MITIFNIDKDSTPLNDDQRSTLILCIDKYANTPEGVWLRDVDYRGTEYKWKESFRNTDVMGAMLGNKVYLQPNKDNNLFWVQLVAPAAIHELRHVWQKQKYGIILYGLMYLISRIPGLYEIAPFEKDAFKQQDMSNEWISRNVR